MRKLLFAGLVLAILTPAAASAQCLPPPVPIIGLDSLCVGDTTSFHDASTGCVWSSSDTAIATVAFAIGGGGAGLVTGISPGLDTIYYTHPAYSYYDPVTATTIYCPAVWALKVIYIKPLPTPPNPVIGVASLCVGASSLFVDVTPDGKWRSSNTSIASVDSMTGVVTGQVVGGATISYEVKNSCGIASTSQGVSVVSCPTQVSNIEEAKCVRLFPNPSGDYLTVCMDKVTNENTSIVITDITGKMVMQETMKDRSAKLNTSLLPDGLYLCKVLSGGINKTYKFIIHH